MNIIDYYRSHGTKILGSFTAALAMIQAILAALSASPDFALLVPHKYLSLMSVVNIVLGVITIRRGFTNSANEAKS